MNIYDISKAADVSIASVSRVINGADNVSEKTRKKVMDVIDRYGYTPNAYARGLGRGSMKTVGIMCSDSSDVYLANAIHYLEEQLRDNGYNSILCCSGYGLENKKASFELLKSRQVDAIIMAGSKYVELNPSDNRYIIDGAKERPVFLLNGCINSPGIYSLLSDDTGGMKQAFVKLHETGARKFIYIYSSDSYSGLQKIRGIENGCKKCSVPPSDIRIVKGVKDFESIATLLEDEYKKEPFDAVIASSDTSGVGAMKFAKRHGLSVPDQLQIVSFNNSILATATNPELTSIDSNLEELCHKTVKSLLKVVSQYSSDADKSFEPVKNDNVLLKTKLIERGTTRFTH